jgi:hypothetical protein
MKPVDCKVTENYPWGCVNKLPTLVPNVICSYYMPTKIVAAAKSSRDKPTCNKCIPPMKDQALPCSLDGKDEYWKCDIGHIHLGLTDSQGEWIFVMRSELNKSKHAGCRIDNTGIMSDCYGDSQVKDWSNLPEDTTDYLKEMFKGLKCLNSLC